ncbi:MAG: hypothetical protein NZO16_00720 [Deltaproteobacteria bacterium]|nr:hypothetical protein [Deltaproteobacteria bacterium]
MATTGDSNLNKIAVHRQEATRDIGVVKLQGKVLSEDLVTSPLSNHLGCYWQITLTKVSGKVGSSTNVLDEQKISDSENVVILRTDFKKFQIKAKAIRLFEHPTHSDFDSPQNLVEKYRSRVRKLKNYGKSPYKLGLIERVLKNESDVLICCRLTKNGSDFAIEPIDFGKILIFSDEFTKPLAQTYKTRSLSLKVASFVVILIDVFFALILVQFT